MNKGEILQRAQEKAKKIKRQRKDPRFQKTMGFLVAKGFLYTNEDIVLQPNAHIKIADAVWAGKNVEPRILEVLPAAVIRLGKHFDGDTTEDIELKQAIKNLLDNNKGTFYRIDLEKIKPWLNLKLKDGRTKKNDEKKVMKSFRLKPSTIHALVRIKKQIGKSESEIIEMLVANEIN